MPAIPPTLPTLAGADAGSAPELDVPAAVDCAKVGVPLAKTPAAAKIIATVTDTQVRCISAPSTTTSSGEAGRS